MRSDTELSCFTPLPPARNGIADYAYMLLGELGGVRRTVVYCDDVLATAPRDVEVRDEIQAFRYLGRSASILHQLGNNGGHMFVLEALRRFGGVVSLHDLNLLYLYELATSRLEPILAGMRTPNPALGMVYGRQWKEHRLKTAANYVLFDMAGETLSLADGIVVHSRFAYNKLRAIYGAEAAPRIAVIPHFAPPSKIGSREAARQRLSIPADQTIILTSGFATRAKRFDWLIEAVDTLLQRGATFRWIHAGEQRPEEFALQEAIDRRPLLRAAATVTGYVAEDDLDAYIAAADLVVNLRFPSVGESSGTLARAFAAGRCCIVSDTAAYAEIPREAAVHIPVVDAVPALVRALEALLGDADLRSTFGERAAHYARTALSLRGAAKQYSDFIDDIDELRQSRSGKAGDRRRRRSPHGTPSMQTVEIENVQQMAAADLRQRVSGIAGPFEAILWFDSALGIARHSLDNPGYLHGIFGPHVTIETVRFLPRPEGPRPSSPASSFDASAAVGLSILGRAYTW